MDILFIGEVDQYLAVVIEDFRFGNKAKVVSLFIYHGEVPCFGVIENLHYLLHAVGIMQSGWR